MSCRHAAIAYVVCNELLVEGVCVWVVDVVVDTCVVVEASWLPELLHISVCVVVVQQEHRGVRDQEEAEEVSLETSIEGLEV
jgi:hypothetical protein